MATKASRTIIPVASSARKGHGERCGEDRGEGCAPAEPSLSSSLGAGLLRSTGLGGAMRSGEITVVLKRTKVCFKQVHPYLDSRDAPAKYFADRCATKNPSAFCGPRAWGYVKAKSNGISEISGRR